MDGPNLLEWEAAPSGPLRLGDIHPEKERKEEQVECDRREF